jgi:hypothetical protein
MYSTNGLRFHNALSFPKADKRSAHPAALAAPAGTPVDCERIRKRAVADLELVASTLEISTILRRGSVREAFMGGAIVKFW